LGGLCIFDPDIPFSIHVGSFDEARMGYCMGPILVGSLESEGGGVTSRTCGGWALDGFFCCGVMRYRDIPGMKQLLSREVLGLVKLKELAGKEMNVEFASMYC
jgi:hypothetical protein